VALVDLEIRRMNDEDILVLILKECRCRMAKKEGHKSKINVIG
jgi:hypothetical protein